MIATNLTVTLKFTNIVVVVVVLVVSMSVCVCVCVGAFVWCEFG